MWHLADSRQNSRPERTYGNCVTMRASVQANVSQPNGAEAWYETIVREKVSLRRNTKLFSISL
jgi:hypothetical protein